MALPSFVEQVALKVIKESSSSCATHDKVVIPTVLFTIKIDSATTATAANTAMRKVVIFVEEMMRSKKGFENLKIGEFEHFKK